MNIYQYQFASTCPNNKRPIIYSLTIETDKMIYVEKIVVAVELQGSQYHEPMADALHAQFGGRQTLKAHHHGVDITTVRGAL